MRVVRLGLALLLVVSVAGCVLGGKGAAKPQPGPNPITGEAIATTSLDAPSGAAKPPAPVPPAAPAKTGAEAAKPIAAVAEKPAALPPVPPPAPQSPQAVACEKDGGAWAGVGTSGAKSCVKPTGDSGKSCDQQSDCEGLCLARSRTCAPIKPMFGCNDILQDDGREVTLCID